VAVACCAAGCWLLAAACYLLALVLHVGDLPSIVCGTDCSALRCAVLCCIGTWRRCCCMLGCLMTILTHVLTYGATTGCGYGTSSSLSYYHHMALLM
jgi:hypothetical protein